MLSRTEQPGAIPATIYTTEPTGDLTYVYINLGSSVIVASAGNDFSANADDPIWVAFDQKQMHLFDAV